jgi:probable F420-dependent oxidoreductase
VQRYSSIFEALSTLVWVAANVRQIRLGTSVLILPQRDPVATAKQLATIDVLSGGRLIVGVGAGYLSEEFAFLGRPFEQRGRLLDEQIAAMRALWSGATSVDSESVSFSGAHFGPIPVQGEHLPIWIGGSSKAALRRAARLGDAWHPAHLSVSTFAEKRRELRRLANGRALGVTLKLRLILSATPGPTARSTQDELPGEAELAGTPAQVRDEVAGYQESGVEELVVVLPHDDEQELEWAMVTFAGEVMGVFR